MALVVAVVSWSVVKKRFHRLYSNGCRLNLCICGSSCAVSRRCMWWSPESCRSCGCVVCTAFLRLLSMELSIQCCSGGTRMVSSCWRQSWNIWRLLWYVLIV